MGLQAKLGNMVLPETLRIPLTQIKLMAITLVEYKVAIQYDSETVYVSHVVTFDNSTVKITQAHRVKFVDALCNPNLITLHETLQHLGTLVNTPKWEDKEVARPEIVEQVKTYEYRVKNGDSVKDTVEMIAPMVESLYVRAEDEQELYI